MLRLCYTYMWIFCLILANIMPVGTLNLILPLKRFFINHLCAFKIDLTKRSHVNSVGSSITWERINKKLIRWTWRRLVLRSWAQEASHETYHNFYKLGGMWNSINETSWFPYVLVWNYFHSLIIKQHLVPTTSTTTKWGFYSSVCLWFGKEFAWNPGEVTFLRTPSTRVLIKLI
jgi:hypothetical protein